VSIVVSAKKCVTIALVHMDVGKHSNHLFFHKNIDAKLTLLGRPGETNYVAAI
jgi:hypothetical protein